MHLAWFIAKLLIHTIIHVQLTMNTLTHPHPFSTQLEHLKGCYHLFTIIVEVS